MNPPEWLREKAKSFAYDGTALRQAGDTENATLFEVLADVLRRCACGARACRPICYCCGPHTACSASGVGVGRCPLRERNTDE